mmetsp:Transcript_15041/g.30896  ORF Transcript_15041/g.30896 Transcript_15041/m.30896 type:complete len:205 (-) Transcript_15041:271-885(-)
MAVNWRWLRRRARRCLDCGDGCTHSSPLSLCGTYRPPGGYCAPMTCDGTVRGASTVAGGRGGGGDAQPWRALFPSLPPSLSPSLSPSAESTNGSPWTPFALRCAARPRNKFKADDNASTSLFEGPKERTPNSPFPFSTSPPEIASVVVTAVAAVVVVVPAVAAASSSLKSPLKSSNHPTASERTSGPCPVRASSPAASRALNPL